MPTHLPELIVPGRFNGPPTSGNGGWTAGALAGELAIEHGDHCADDCPHNRADAWPAIEVTLHQPPPVDTAMSVACRGEDAGISASFGGAAIVSARQAATELRPVEPVPGEEARAAMAGYPGLVSHPFPTCFVCGTGREEDDGLDIHGGPVADSDGRPRIASVWVPDPSLSEDFHAYVDETPRASLAATWASLDCIGGWSCDIVNRPMVLGRMTARIDTLPAIGEEHVVVGTHRGQEGRKTFTASTLYDADGRVVGTAEHVWITIDPSAFG